MRLGRRLLHFVFGCRSQRARLVQAAKVRGIDLTNWPIDFCRDCGARMS